MFWKKESDKLDFYEIYSINEYPNIYKVLHISEWVDEVSKRHVLNAIRLTKPSLPKVHDRIMAFLFLAIQIRLLFHFSL